MELGKSHFQTKDFPNLWVFPVACEDPESNYILIYQGTDGVFCFNYKDIIVKPIEIDSLFDEFPPKIILDHDDFERNYGIEFLSVCTQEVEIDWAAGNHYYELVEIPETFEQFVFDKSSGEKVYDISPKLYGEELLEDITEQFNILPNEEVWKLRETIAKRKFPYENLHYGG